MKKIWTGTLVCLVCMAWGIACTSNKTLPAGTQSPQPTSLSSPSSTVEFISDLIGYIRQSPQDHLGAEVEITGYFQGWNLQGSLDESPPVTRSDWVIADNSGAIYVTGKLPEDLDPASLEDAGTLVHLIATVGVSKEQVYLEALIIDVLSEP